MCFVHSGSAGGAGLLASLAPYTEASQFSDPSPGQVPSAIPSDQPYNSGAPFVQLFKFERGQSGGFATFTAADPTQLAMSAEMLGHGYYQTTGTGPDLMENAKNAVRDMIDWLAADQQLSLHEAYTLCSVAGDLKINETVDLPNWLVSMTLPRGIFA